jgi:C4-dicarboxylate transporter
MTEPSNKKKGMTPAKKYNLRILVTAIAYIVLLFFSVSLLNTVENEVARFALAVLPMLPIVLGLGAFITLLREMDELQRRIHFEGFAFSMALTGLITFTVGLLENAGFPSFGIIWVFPMLIAFWGIGSGIARKRYE